MFTWHERVKKMSRNTIARLTVLALIAGGIQAKSVVVNLQKFVQETGFDKAETKEFEKAQEEVRRKIEPIATAIETIKNELNGEKGKALSKEARSKKEQEAAEKQQDLNNETTKAQQKLQQKQAELQGRLFQRLRSYASRLLKGKVTMVQDPSGAIIVYDEKKVDATAELTKIAKEEMAKEAAETKPATSKPTTQKTQASQPTKK